MWLNKKILFLLIMQCFIGTWLKNHGSHILPQFSHHPYLTILIMIIIDHDFIFLIEWLEYMMMSVHLYANITWYPKSNFKSIFFFQIREKWRRRGDHVCMCARARVCIYIYMGRSTKAWSKGQEERDHAYIYLAPKNPNF